MDIKHLKYFIAIAEEGNITSAAKRLHILQPPLSMQLKLQEEELGIAVIPKSAAKIIEGNNLKTKVIDETNLYTRLGVIYRKSTNLSKAAKSFIKLFN
ncbi:hypothetical protein UT300003_35200 [Clostridium sardiniense]